MAHGVHHLLRGLDDQQPRARRERDDGVRVGLDRQDEVRIQVEWVRGVPELVKADHGRAL
jgi:hypothetical protein